MKTKNKAVLTCILSIALALACLPSSIYASIVRNYKELFNINETMAEEDVFNSKRDMEGKDLVSEIITLEKALPYMDDKIAILPHLMALVEKTDEFTPSELIELIKDEQTGIGLESALVKMYNNMTTDSTELLLLLNDDNIADETKEYKQHNSLLTFVSSNLPY